MKQTKMAGNLETVHTHTHTQHTLKEKEIRYM